MRVPFLDLKRLNEECEPELSEAVQRVVRSGRYILGPEVEAFEAEVSEYLGGCHAVAVSSGSDALVAALLAAGVGAGHNVATSAFSFFATPEAILRVGATPVVVDVDLETLNMKLDAAKLRELEKTHGHIDAIVPVHLFGRPCNVAALHQPVIEDACQAIGAGGVAGRGTAACYSFFPSKNLGALGDGGLVTCWSTAMRDALRSIRQHGMTARRYDHDRVGGNFRLDAIQAAALRVKLGWLDAWTERRRALAARYTDGLDDLELLALPPMDEDCVWNQYVVRVLSADGTTTRRDELQAFLAARRIDTQVYYPLPLDVVLQQVQREQAHITCPNAWKASREVLALPMDPNLSRNEVDYVIESLRAFFAVEEQ